MGRVHRMVSAYLEEYVSKGAKELSGSDFSRLVNQLALAKEDGLLSLYNDRLLEKIVQVFLRTYKDSLFSARDIV